ncbi:porin family protein, partial [Vibrio anguillarum]|nr:porin family protein [Vibrio anguillarum]
MKIPFLTLLLLISSSAYAVNHQIGVGIGYGGTEGPNNWDDSGFAGKIDYSYQFHPNFSTEIGYAGVDGMTNNIISTTF